MQRLSTKNRKLKMKITVLYIALAVSVVINIILSCVLLPKSCSNNEDDGSAFSNAEVRKEAAEAMAKKLV
jgi:hypothetical protein